MTDLEGRIPDPLIDELDVDETPSPLRTFVGLFVVPLLVVLACVGVFIGFGWIAYERNDVGDYVGDLSHWSRPRRAQAAYELAKILIADPQALNDQPDVGARVREVFAEADNPEIRRYLILVLGYTRDRAAVPDLLELLGRGEPEERIYTLWALGAIGDPVALPSLQEALRSEDPGLRKTAAYALGELALPESAPRLRVALEDPVADVRWNAALALARLGSDAGFRVLEEMLDRASAGQVPGITPEQQEDAMIEAVRAVAAVGGARSLPLLGSLARTDPSLKVRQAAIEASRAVRERSGQG